VGIWSPPSVSLKDTDHSPIVSVASVMSSLARIDQEWRSAAEAADLRSAP
jgi:hypothetical protein